MIYRNYFGTWGRELSDGDFACALAALGVIDTRRFKLLEDGRSFDDLKFTEAELVHPVPWKFRSARFASTGIEPDETPEALVKMWKESTLPGAARLEVDRATRVEGVDSAAMLTWIVSELSRTEVNARSVYLRVDRPSVTVGWQWPLRIGFLADDESQGLKKCIDSMIAGEGWIQPLADTVNVENRNACDLLLLPWDLRKSLARAASLESEIRADCTIVMGRATGDASHWYRMIDGLRASIRTSGVAIINRGLRDVEKWLINTVASLSHNAPIDVALFESKDKPSEIPFVTISRRLADFSRVAMQMRRAAKAMRRPTVRDVTAAMEGPAADTVMSGTGMHSLDHVADALDRGAEMADSAIRSGSFEHETGGATGAAMARRSADRAVAAAAPPPALEEERFIEAQVFDVSAANEPERLTHRFRSGGHHEIKVRVGVADDEWIATTSGPRFPVDALPQDQDEWELTAVLSVAQSDDDPQIAKFILPRFGNSSECSFFLHVKETWKNVEARIVVLHRNRVIQTAMLEGKVGSSDASDDRITVEPEVIAKSHFESLDTRERFAASLVINKSKSGVHRLLAIADDKVKKFTPPPQLTDEIQTLDEILADVADNPKTYKTLTSKATVSLLRELANQGNVLYDILVGDTGIDTLGSKDGPLQIVSAVPDARLPVEFVYSRRAPVDSAKLCPNAAKSLRAGKCAASCSKPDQEENFICPLAFWGMQRVIERHMYTEDSPKVAPGSGFAVVSEPTNLRPSLDLLAGAQVAGSQRVEKTVPNGLENICELLSKATGSTLKPIQTWSQWTTGIKGGPALLLLVVHTEESPTNRRIPRMEIGTASWLESSKLEWEHIVKQNGNPPLVLLIGCETGVTDREFANFVTRIRSRGAAIVVATGAKIHSIHAVPVAKEFVNRIQEASKTTKASFGEVMLQVRREMLADGIPMVLTLNAYGDADWRLAKHS